ncbi:hypothetical protein BOTBODRAFT_377791 [Botryobasidium botryosum FD-172 SS1]|uniref:Uncharacterized protein n=1 Tax=Botryobasidium botryosum (strain FD-172 SS1) TaxID=930990 RepID=A0A067N6R0_BOTB1|nr:hypothetical protein BOTBODRAFT_377791 [Botryobasidium botryosum FD-172 SS1]
MRAGGWMRVVAHGSRVSARCRGRWPVLGVSHFPYSHLESPRGFVSEPCVSCLPTRGSVYVYPSGMYLAILFTSPSGHEGWRLDVDGRPWKLSVRVAQETGNWVSHPLDVLLCAAHHTTCRAQQETVFCVSRFSYPSPP